jgi:hypothetical protein
MDAGSDIRAALHAVMQRGADSPIATDEFDALALQSFTHQFEHNAPYRAYCERRRLTPANVSGWTEIPAVPTAAFKEVALVAGDPADAQAVFRTSGTTRGAEKRGAHYILDPSLYEASLRPTFRHFVLDDAPKMRVLSLIAPYEDAPDSSLSYMVSTIVRELGTADSEFFAYANGLRTDALNRAIESLGAPVCLLGTSLAFLHWLDSLGAVRYELPEGSRLMDTGGFKGEARTVSALDMRARYMEKLALATANCMNEYSMTELCSQYYDAGDQVKRGPSWLRARIVDPETLDPVAPGETGIIQHFDLANLDSVCAVQTEDLAFESENGFVLLGRAPGAAPRGCSIAMDLLLSGSGP